MTKICSASQAVAHIQSGHRVMVGGFGLVGAPLTMINEMTNHNVKDLTIISNNIGEAGRGLGILLRQGKIKKAIGSYFTSNREVGELYNQGKLDVQLIPQGTFSESIRAGGAGIGGFYTKTGVGTELVKDKEERVINDERYVFEEAIKADVAIVKAWKADKLGNLVFYKTARNFNPAMATAAEFVIAEVDEIVEAGELSPEEIVTPHLYVNAIVESRFILTTEGVVEK